MARPVEFNEEVVRKLEEAFSLDATITEACFYAGISRDTYYEHTRNNKELTDRFEELRNNPVMLARKTVVAKLGENYGNAMDYLKRKRRKEFGDSTDITSGGEKLSITFDNAFKDDSSEAGAD